jgi:hypothetical protein
VITAPAHPSTRRSGPNRTASILDHAGDAPPAARYISW